jgi:hypothetical protein
VLTRTNVWIDLEPPRCLSFRRRFRSV